MTQDQTPANLPGDGDDTAAAHRHERLFAAHYLPVMRLCLHRLRDVDDAEDAVQEVFRRAVQHSADLNGDPLPWLITVAKRVCLDELRRRRSGLDHITPTDTTPAAEPADAEANPERLVVGQLFVRELLGRLTPAERRVIAARVYSTDSSADTAELLGVSSSTTRVLLARARQKLRTYLESGQAAVAGVPVLLTRSLYGLRRRLLERPWVGDGSMAMALPVALAIAVATGPAATVPHAEHPTLSSPLAMAPDRSSLPDESSAGHTTDGSSGGHGNAVHSPSGARPVSPTEQRSPDDPLGLLTPADPHRVEPFDLEPSPEYSQDHTIFMTGTQENGCNDYSCERLFKSTDGGQTWNRLTAQGLLSSLSIIMPLDEYQQGHFYMFGSEGGLEMTPNNGDTFVPVAPNTGFVAAAPPGSGLSVVVSNSALWGLEGMTPVLLATYSDPNLVPAGQAAFIQTSTGEELLQPLGPRVLGPPDVIERCSAAGCGDPTTLPFNGSPIQLVASPNVLLDHTIFVVNVAYGIAVSHDDGHSFKFIKQVPIQHLVVTAGPKGQRLVALVGLKGVWDLEYSDDGGLTWIRAAIRDQPDLMSALTVTALPGGALVASVERRQNGPYYDIVCSADATSWSPCTTTGG